MRRRLLACTALAASSTIVATSSCGPEFLPATLIVNERVLAIVADPPEAVPGQSVTLTPLVVGPKGELVEGTDYEGLWWRCPDEDSDALGDFVRCTTPAARRTLGEGPTFVDVVPLDLFGPLPAPGQPPPDPPPDPTTSKLVGALLGYWRVVGFEIDVVDGVEGARRVQAIKREVVHPPVALGEVDPRLAELDVRVDDAGEIAPNTNPALGGIEIREGAPDGPSVLSVKPGGTYFFKPRYDERTLQEYFALKVDLAGLDLEDEEALRNLPEDELRRRFEKVQRCEIPVFSWYATAGELRREDTVDETVIERVYDPRGVPCPALEGEIRTPEVRFTAPAADDARLDDGVVHVWVVLRDGRGGTAFRSLDVPVSTGSEGGD